MAPGHLAPAAAGILQGPSGAPFPAPWAAALQARVDLALQALGLALFVPHCGACATPMATRPHHRLCATCLPTLQPATAELGCRRCGAPQPQDATTCRICAAQGPSPAAHPTYSSLYAPYIYGGALREMVRGAKFMGREDLATALGHLLADDAQAHSLAMRVAEAGGRVLPLPLGARRLRQRGYNQSGAIARVLCRRWQLPLSHGLIRCRDTVAQSELGATARQHNVAGAFRARGALHGPILLIDDVVTSGASVDAAAQALRAGGAPEVVVLSVARARLTPSAG